MKTAVVLFNLGGPDSLDAVQPFLENLFSDPAIIPLPGILRKPLAMFIARQRAPIARKIYEHIGGYSPIFRETQDQANALEEKLNSRGRAAKCFIAMRCWRPFTAQTVAEVKAFGPDRVVLLPLYPQYSTTTSRSSFLEWRKEAARQNLTASTGEICCYPYDAGFVTALAAIIREAIDRIKPGLSYRLLFSAHGLPKRTVAKGDPYQWQVEATVRAVVDRLALQNLEWQISYQSRVGRLEWIGPSTDAEVRRAGADKRGLIVVPVAFVSEHSETLVELDIEYRKLAEQSGVRDYIRLSAVRTHSAFVAGLADLVETAMVAERPVTCAPGRICPVEKLCGQEV